MVDEAIRFRAPGYHRTRAYQTNRWDGYTRLFNAKYGTFPTGLINRVLDALYESRHRVQIVDRRKKPPIDLPEDIVLNGIELRDVQYDAIEAAIEGERGVLWASTGFGKTEVMCGLIYALKVNTIILTHKKELLYQTAERIQKRLDIEPGIIGDGIFAPRSITVCMFQTAANLLKDELSAPDTVDIFKQFDMVVIDEAHHVSTAKTFNKVVKAIPAYYRFGVSATPFKDPPGTELPLIGVTGELLYSYDLSKAVEEGISVKPYCFMLKYENDNLLPARYGTYAEAYTEAIVRNDVRNDIIIKTCRKAVAGGLPTAVIVERIEHGEALSKLTGLPFVSGIDDAEDRRRVLNAVNNGKTKGVISTVIDEGVDIPNLACIILAAGGKAPHRLIQRIGRGIRRGNHDFCVVVDFYDWADPDDEDDLFYAQTQKRITTYNRHGFDFKIVDKLPDFRTINA